MITGWETLNASALIGAAGGGRAENNRCSFAFLRRRMLAPGPLVGEGHSGSEFRSTLIRLLGSGARSCHTEAKGLAGAVFGSEFLPLRLVGTTGTGEVSSIDGSAPSPRRKS